MTYAQCQSLTRVVRFTIFLLLVPALMWAQGEQPKSKDEILDGLLGEERAPGGMRKQEGGGGEAQGRIALPIHFEYNSARISDESTDQLKQVAQALGDPRLSSARIRIEGHTDQKGSDAYNLQLSRERATAVKRFLIDKEGVNAKRLESVGYGEGQPLKGVSQDTEEGLAANRRVEFVNLGTGPAPAAAAPAAGMSVDVLLSYKSGGEVRKVAPGAVLRAQDNYRVSFTPARSGYVYVYEVDAGGKASSVYPNPANSSLSNPVEAKRRYNVPEGDNWLRLGQQAGAGEIVVLGAEQALKDPEAVVAQLLSDERAPAGTRPDLGAGDIFTYRVPFTNQ